MSLFAKAHSVSMQTGSIQSILSSLSTSGRHDTWVITSHIAASVSQWKVYSVTSSNWALYNLYWWYLCLVVRSYDPFLRLSPISGTKLNLNPAETAYARKKFIRVLPPRTATLHEWRAQNPPLVKSDVFFTSFYIFNSFCTYEIIDVLSITQFSWILELVDSIMHGFEFQPVLAHTLSICTKGTYDSSFWSHKSNSIRHWVTLQLRKLSHRSLSRNVMLCTLTR